MHNDSEDLTRFRLNWFGIEMLCPTIKLQDGLKPIRVMCMLLHKSRRNHILENFSVLPCLCKVQVGYTMTLGDRAGCRFCFLIEPYIQMIEYGDMYNSQC